MKTVELKKIVEDNDGVFKNNVDDAEIYIYHKCENVADINKNRVNEFNLYSCPRCPRAIAQSILDYAYTPLEEREEEKKYRLKSKLIEFESDRDLYLINSSLLKKYCLSTNIRQSFTQKEIDAMPFDTKFFEKVEVE